MTKPSPDPARRRWLARSRDVAAATAAAAVLGPVAPVAGRPAATPRPQPRPASRGYRETERTQRYYALARF